jgi:hypothetical protein
MINRIKKVKLKGNESFNIREGWLRKGMRQVKQHSDLFSRDDVMELLGVGSKMVKSIRYWLQATGLCEEKYINGGHAHAQFLTEDFGEIINQCDPYFDDFFTLSLLHYNIVSNDSLCIVWNIFFNEYEGQDFTKENMIEMCIEILRKKMDKGASFSESSFADDCASIIRMYLSVTATEDPEESLACPLSDLGLLQKSFNVKGAFNKSTPSRENLDKLAVLYVISKNLSADKNSVSIDDLLYAPNNIGRVFNLNRVLINEYLDQLRISGYLTLNRTAGLDMVYIENPMPTKDIMLDYYKKAQVN